VATFTDPVGTTKNIYYYRVFASNVVGDAATPGFPTKTVNSGFSNTVPYPLNTPLTAPAAPSNATAVGERVRTRAAVTLNWTDNAINESGYTVQRATNAAFTANLVAVTLGANTTSYYSSGLSQGTIYYFRIRATNSIGPSAWVNATPFPITTP
jgi:predicted phage tail protein